MFCIIHREEEEEGEMALSPRDDKPESDDDSELLKDALEALYQLDRYDTEHHLYWTIQ